jgi:hypothetical protein
MFVLPEALYSPHSSAQNIVFLNDDPVFSGFQYSRVAVTPGSAAQAAAYIQRAINVLIWEDWFFPEAYDVRSLHCSHGGRRRSGCASRLGYHDHGGNHDAHHHHDDSECIVFRVCL